MKKLGKTETGQGMRSLLNSLGVIRVSWLGFLKVMLCVLELHSDIFTGKIRYLGFALKYSSKTEKKKGRERKQEWLKCW